MPSTQGLRDANEFELVRRGPSHQFAERLGLAPRRFVKVMLLWLVTWVPLALLSWAAGNAIGDAVKLPFFRDPEVHARLLFVVPVLELAAVVVSVSLAAQARHLREMGIVTEREQAKLQAAQTEAGRLRGSGLAEGAILVLSVSLSVVVRLIMGVTEGDSSWERVGSSITLAGWWHTLISLPTLYFFLLRWVWIFGVWAWYLFRVSRLDLQLTATHPDRSGGLGFLGWGLACFATVVMGVSAVFSAGFADEILHRGASLDSLKYHVVAYVVAALIVVHAPLVAFSGQLSRCRFTGMLEFGALVWRHDRAFDEKWLKNADEIDVKGLLGTSDVQSLADIATCYEHVNRMWLIPADMKAIAVLLLAALLPMVPLVGTEIPLQEIFSKLGELLI